MRPAPGYSTFVYRPSGATFALTDHHVTDDREVRVTCAALEVTEPEVVPPSFEGEVLARPGDRVVQDGDGYRGLSVWPRERCEQCFEEARP